ncbi:dimethylarginine dimethylaminohydrolase family protein [Nocardioides hungaricus]
MWGADWGASTEVGPLRKVLLRRPGTEFDAVDLQFWDDHAGAAFDPDGRWYWPEKEPPNLVRMQAQHDNLVATLRSFGVETHVLDPLPGYVKSVYMRDPLITVKGGAVIGRLAPWMRRGEESDVTRQVAALGMPILGTITGHGFMEGGSFVKLNRNLAVFGTSVRCNQAAADQLSDLLKYQGIEVIAVPLSGFDAFHIDGTLAMIDTDLALLTPESAPHWMPDLLREHGIQPIWAPSDEGWAVNGLNVSPGHVILSESAPRTVEILESIGVKVTVIAYDAVQAGGGGIHCSTMELLRDDV